LGHGVCMFLIRDWNEFTSCLSTKGVTFDDMYKYLSTYAFSDRHYNGSIASYRFFNMNVEGQCVVHVSYDLTPAQHYNF